jgi:hypothetical protein
MVASVLAFQVRPKKLLESATAIDISFKYELDCVAYVNR